jgi:alpha-ribazole phosphatase/probable phosphoglycerate mutase
MAGWTDLPLSPQGRLQIERLTQHLAGRPGFDLIYASPLLRTSETARLLAGAGLGRLEFCTALKEINCGELDGLPVDEVQRRFPELWRENWRQSREDFRWPGGESYREFRERCLAAVRSIAAAHLSGRIAMVTHAGVISQIIGFISGVSAARWELFRPGNASVTELTWLGSSGIVLSFDSRAHLMDPV